MIIQSQRVWINQQFVPAQIHFFQHRIINITPYNTQSVDIDYGNHRIVPGFIDNHIHGAFGYDTIDANPEGLHIIKTGLVREGVTSFCPTTVTQDSAVILESLRCIAQYAQRPSSGANIVGVHLEGPFLNVNFKGAQNADYIMNSDIDIFNSFYEASSGLIKIVTMASEKDNNFSLIHHCHDLKIVVSLGHSGATFDDAMLAVAHGASCFTHTFNGMSGIHHRNYNLAGAAHRLSGIYAEIIADGNHVVWPAVHTLMMAKGPFHSILITDSLSVKGSSQGEYTLGGQRIEVKADGSAYLQGTNTLSGSTLKMNEGLRNLVELAQVPFQYALNAATINPATLLNIHHKKGKIAYHYDADIVVLDDNYTVLATYVNGTCEYHHEDVTP